MGLMRRHSIEGSRSAQARPDGRLVSRDMLCSRVLQAVRAHLVTITGPAGVGKTTLMVQLRSAMSDAGLRTAWLELDRTHNDAPHFVAAIVSALTALVTQAGSERRAPFGARLGPGQAGMLVFHVLERLGGRAARSALFLDDLEAVDDPAVLSLLREILERKPDDCIVVLGTRRLPDLGLGRYRVNEELVEIGADDLRFSLGQTREFFDRRGIACSDDDLGHIHRATEGWVAAINLASMAHANGEAPASSLSTLTAEHGAIAQYLAEEVFQRLIPATQDFLIRTAILSELEEPLCDVLTKHAQSGMVLHELRRSNLFLVPTQPGAQTCRYHSLFAGFLRRLLEQRLDAAQRVQLHRTAARWYLEQGRPVQAVEHFLQGRDFDHAAELISARAEELLNSGRMNLLGTWLQALPGSYLESEGRLRVASLWATCFTRGPWDAMAMAQKPCPADEQDGQTRQDLQAINSSLLVMMDRAEEVALTRQAADKEGRLSFSEGMGASYMAYAYLVNGMHAHAYAMIDASRRGTRSADFRMMYTESMAGILTLTEGRLHEAVASFHAAIDASRRDLQGPASADAWPGVLYAGALYQMNDLDRAESLLSVYVPMARDIGLADHLIAGYRMLSRIASSRGNVEAAYDRLIDLELVGTHRQLPRIVSAAKLERSRLHLMQGHQDAARDELERASDKRVWDRVARLHLPAHETECRDIAWSRYLVHVGAADEALHMIDPLLSSASTQKRFKRALKLRLLRSIALRAVGDIRQAHQELRGVLQASQREGLIRAVVDEGLPARRLIEETFKAPAAADASASAVGDYVETLLRAFSPGKGMSPPTPPAARETASFPPGRGTPTEALTRKEVRLLMLLAQGHSNEELARLLFVSTSTVRTHLRHINAKLQTRSRTQAVAVARALGLIP